jgi:hypothetical protein
MSDKQFEKCTLEEATHVEVGGKVYLLGEPYHGKCIGIRWWDTDTFIPEELFSTLGIKPFKEKKREPIEFEAVFVKHDGQWRQLLTIDDGISIQNCKVARFRCVEILEEEK